MCRRCWHNFCLLAKSCDVYRWRSLAIDIRKRRAKNRCVIPRMDGNAIVVRRYPSRRVRFRRSFLSALSVMGGSNTPSSAGLCRDSGLHSEREQQLLIKFSPVLGVCRVGLMVATLRPTLTLAWQRGLRGSSGSASQAAR
jgi:hypothetical protein